MVNLRVLDGSDNYLTGPIPDSYINLKSLYKISLHNNQLNGTLDICFALPNISIVMMQGNKHSGSLPTMSWPSLSSIILYQNQLTGKQL
jgi:hypothetical protein